MSIFIPPKKLNYLGGRCILSNKIEIKGHPLLLRKYSNLLKDFFRRFSLTEEKEVLKIELSYLSSRGVKDSYQIVVKEQEIIIKGEDERGVFYAIQTLFGLIGENEKTILCVEIEDNPDFINRGFLHDITRGKIPTFQTLKKIVDKCAEYRINQLQLYTEHSYAFKVIPEFSEKFDTIQEEEIKELDNYCKEKHIELVPCLATFGHLYELLRLPRFEHLNELNIRASTFPHNLWDRMAHYTIDPLNEESFFLIRSMIEEYASLFSSKYFNICCDETFDLGKGKNREIAQKVGIGKLYVDFVNKLCKVVRDLGKIPMIWGDIVLKYPEIVSELPAETIFLNWNYSPSVTEESVKFFYERGVSQYVCPGVWGWSRFANEINKATENIRRQIEFGKKYNAKGVLITDWGDCGHVNFFTSSLHGLALGSFLSWNSESVLDNDKFDVRLSEYEWGKAASLLYKNLREIGSLCDYHFGNIYAWVNNIDCLWNKEKDIDKWELDFLYDSYNKALEIINYLENLFQYIPSYKKEDFEEILWGARAIRYTIAILIVKLIVEYGKKGKFVLSPLELIEESKKLKDNFISLWLRKNKKSELENVISVFDKVIEKLVFFSMK